MTWESFRTAVIKLIPALGGVISLAWLFIALVPRGTPVVEWWTIAKLGAAVIISFAIVAMLRYALGPFMEKPAQAPITVTSSDAVRDRIAPIVLAVGGAAIAILAFGLIIAFSVLASDPSNDVLKGKVDSLLMGVFTAVLPVFATWVGTVIAFYFTNESFRQAAQTAREAAQGFGSAERVTDRMIPYAKIAKIEEERAQARAITMDRVMKLFNDNTTRIIVFDKSKQPVFILRRKSPPMPKEWVPESPATFADKTIDDYVKANDGKNAADATSFGFIAENATLDVARAEMIKSGSEDIFVTASGQKTEEVLGWLPKDKLK
ncbi:hypothetical protein [Rhizobium sp. BK251]|uniref:hypothetical protein n=1 Tax=Rhizobium sp. BK251 TaxID=2512125 RepID=UPI00104892E2|nr:hypothetical protein [Rhizobium sp. BK251]TCL75994.1 hypothetical protein EV286_101541 [Rhizobium sp. BK251]